MPILIGSELNLQPCQKGIDLIEVWGRFAARPGEGQRWLDLAFGARRQLKRNPRLIYEFLGMGVVKALEFEIDIDVESVSESGQIT